MGKVEMDRQDHLYASRIVNSKLLDARRVIARSYLRSLPRKLFALIKGTEEGPAGQGCWQEGEPHNVNDIPIF